MSISRKPSLDKGYIRSVKTLYLLFKTKVPLTLLRLHFNTYTYNIIQIYP